MAQHLLIAGSRDIQILVEALQISITLQHCRNIDICIAHRASDDALRYLLLISLDKDFSFYLESLQRRRALRGFWLNIFCTQLELPNTNTAILKGFTLRDHPDPISGFLDDDGACPATYPSGPCPDGRVDLQGSQERGEKGVLVSHAASKRRSFPRQ